MFRLALSVAVFAAVGCHVALSSYSVEEAGVLVVFPSDYDRKMSMSMADFGEARYGGSLRGQLVYPVNTPKQMECLPAPCQYGCTPFNSTQPSPWKINKQPGQNYIMLLDRGPRDMPNVSPCLFLDKVYNAMLAGADAVLVANDVDSQTTTTIIAPEDDDTAKELESISISAAMISKADADFLKDLMLVKNKTVTLMLTWSTSVPQAKTVNWEFWSNSDDSCGAACGERIKFLQDMKEQSQKLENSNLTKFTPRYFLWKCPAEELNSTECKRDCVSNGTYCAQGHFNANFTGQQVLEMDIRSICFFNLASADGKGVLWWDYATRVASNCSTKANNYTVACASSVFEAVGGPALANGTGKAAWDTCAAFNAGASSFPVLEDNLKSMLGDDTKNITAITILPSIRVNNVQYRGSLTSNYVLRALCAGFRAGEEPDVCLSESISEDECKPGGVGYQACQAEQFASVGKTRCINTFRGYTCECKTGMQLYTDPFTLQDRCEDVNECLATNVPLQQDACKCERCACVNKIGSFNCTGELPLMCDAQHNHGGCWHTDINGTAYNACVDDIANFKALAARGERTEADKWYKCECPKCFQLDKDGINCVPRCDLSVCDSFTGSCPGKDDSGKATGGGGSGGGGGTASGGGGGGGGGGSSKSAAGTSVGFLIMVALGSALLTGVIVFVANRYLMRQRMGSEIRDIMAQYMPLQAATGGGAPGARGPPRVIRPDEDSDEEGHVGAFGWPAARSGAPAATATPPAPVAPTLAAASSRAVWGPTSVSVAPKAAQAHSAAAPTPAPRPAPAPSRPAVDVFTISGPDDSVADAPGPSSAGTRAAGGGSRAPSGSADPLLGLTLGSSTSLEGQTATTADSKPGRHAGGDENPLL